MKLSELVSKAVELENQIIVRAEETQGEIDPILDAFLEDIKNEIKEKSDSYKFVMDSLTARAQMLEATANKYLRVANALEKTNERIQSTIKEIMLRENIHILEGKDWTFKIVPTAGRVEVWNEREIPASLTTVKTTVTPNKDEIKKRIQLGEEVPGAKVIPGWSLRVSIRNRGKI